MKLVMLYRPNSEFATSAEQFAREFERRTSKKIQPVDVDSKEGIRMVELYRALDHPCFMAIADDGRLIQGWSGKPLPQINELSTYAKDM